MQIYIVNLQGKMVYYHMNGLGCNFGYAGDEHRKGTKKRNALFSTIEIYTQNNNPTLRDCRKDRG